MNFLIVARSKKNADPASRSHKVSMRVPKRRITLEPRNLNQRLYMDALVAENPPIVLGTGAAGTGKTLLSSLVGIQKLYDGSVQKLVLTRPTVSTDEQLGMLPGDIRSKMDPWIQPFMDSFQEFYSLTKINHLIEEGAIEICPLGFARGRTFNNSYIILDEAQSTTPNQMLMLMTRIGRNSKLVITGDLMQCERGFERNGLRDLVRRLELTEECPIVSESFARVHFKDSEVERNPVIETVLALYKKD